MLKENYSKIFTWLFIGLIITFVTGYSLSLNTDLAITLASGSSYLVIAIVEIVIAIFFSLRLAKMSRLTATICYILYSFLTGITFGSIFLVFELTSIMNVFLITSIVFLIFALVAMHSKKDFSKLSLWLGMSLLAIVVASLLNIFFRSSVLNLIITIVSIVIFIGYIIFDLKNAENIMTYIDEDKGAIYVAFQLYLDFINLFLDLLRLLGNQKDD